MPQTPMLRQIAPARDSTYGAAAAANHRALVQQHARQSGPRIRQSVKLTSTYVLKAWLRPHARTSSPKFSICEIAHVVKETWTANDKRGSVAAAGRVVWPLDTGMDFDDVAFSFVDSTRTSCPRPGLQLAGYSYPTDGSMFARALGGKDVSSLACAGN
ncbi:hypothetical protein MPTK1_8g12250 [Marchantia polymorpha subsp. ruderalis]|uniref:Uncharacterized protein n=1 Tax=Marchantia polymorpha TaxID=3197 RepID=A0A2R6WJU2_MARPO|nr:hypothetical protein MARPO_0083s0093 [Marchantia polymorpha]BBN19631.1 hypothetical protein Mp_8g12250 [Marchantia polymorpha subsp. ruderalis]|eukprot:PTQ34135.1 hypothetical protein MARPO_0083s0093 [Marchantia polymorpha]